MPVTLIASACPAVQAVNAPIYAQDVYDGLISPEISSAMSTGLYASLSSSTINKNNTLHDLSAKYGSGGYAIGYGLAISAGSGFTLNVSAGHAIINGLVELSDAATLTLDASISRIYIWFNIAGGLVAVNNSTTAPSSTSVFLGSAVTDGSGITSVDTSGVMYWKSGMLYRETADIFAPTDTPAASIRCLTKTLSGEFIWTGTKWSELAEPGHPRWKKVLVDHDDFVAAATTESINVHLLPANAVVHSAMIKVTTAFSGGSVSTLLFDIGISGTLEKYLSDVSGTSTGRTLEQPSAPTPESTSSSIQVLLTATSTGGNVADLTAGAAEIWLLYSVPA